VNGNNSVEEEIKGGISLGNKAFYANQDLFKSKPLTKNSKLQVYKTLVRPVVTCACETWVLKENIKTKLRVFERKVLRKIHGHTKGKDGTWRIKSNEELNRLTCNKNIINYIKAQRLAWLKAVCVLMQCLFFLFCRKIAWRQLGRKAGKSPGSTIHLDGIENEPVFFYKSIIAKKHIFIKQR
jgi:hypothetical protein